MEGLSPIERANLFVKQHYQLTNIAEAAEDIAKVIVDAVLCERRACVQICDTVAKSTSQTVAERAVKQVASQIRERNVFSGSATTCKS